MNLVDEYNQGSPYENLIMHILFPKEPEHKNNYIYSTYPNTPHVHVGGPRTLGNYERTLLDKILNPIMPAICVTGDMGSGKTTTFQHINRYYLRDRLISRAEDNRSCDDQKSGKRTLLLGYIDFKNYRPLDTLEENYEKLYSLLIDEMRAKISFLIDNQHELIDFWDIISEKYFSGELETSDVARKIQSALSGSGDFYSDYGTRENAYNQLCQDSEYYFRYLILLWRFLTDKQVQKRILSDPSKCHITHSLVVLDNLDSLPEAIQRWMYDLVITSVGIGCPTFILFLRPETLRRLGVADKVFDYVTQSYIDPYAVVIDRLAKFIEKPNQYFNRVRLLTSTEKQDAINYMKRLMPELQDSNEAFRGFLSAGSGNSIRLGLFLAQGILLLPPSEIIKDDLSAHYVIRACIRQGKPIFHSSRINPIENLFYVHNSDRTNILLKPRILKYLFTESNIIDLPEDKEPADIVSDHIYRRYSRLENKLRNDFILFNYKPTIIKAALYELTRPNCQLVYSSGYDIRRHDDYEIIYLTKIGVGYITHLIFSFDYLQEVMMDVMLHIPGFQVPSSDKLTDRAFAVSRFLRYLREKDRDDVKSVIDKLKSPDWYITNFGEILLTTEILQNIYPAIGKILQRSVTRHPSSRRFYQELLETFENELRLAEKDNKALLGAQISVVDTFVIN